MIPTDSFKLILEFENKEHRTLDIKSFLKDDTGKLAEVRDNLIMFQTVKIDSRAGTICWDNGVDLDPEIVYFRSVPIWRKSK
ncbi:DUF2442 domain-containing protein [Aneurinibacillus tyrosinisolvens]|uniref:DUF2442 domain-containing protein n=1 Tax=Aneurinibacillus tyrosinisolvens TaxID=1443435 RepID=UPI0034E1A7D5